ncbi:MAG: conjugal transfer protein TraG N-terminal domain-containing protein [Dissulfurispiraceae bacterium]|jgi:hypothetical protein
MKNKLLSSGLFCILFLLVSAPAWAYNGEYYTYGGFHEIADTFQSVALVFSDSKYNTIIGLMLVIGITGGIARAIISGPGLGKIFMPLIIGIAIHQGFIIPKGNLAIYDPVRNESTIQGNLPDGIVILASAFNVIERAIVDIIATSGPLDYNSQAGGIAFDIMQSLPANLVVNDQYINGSFARYIQDCVVPEMASPTYTPPITPNNLRSNDNFMTLFVAAANPAMYTVFYQDKDGNCVNATSPFPAFAQTYRGGCAEQCAQAYNDINAAIADPNAFSNGINQMCAENGFDITNVQELQACQDILTTGINLLLNNASYTIQNIATQNAVSQALNTAMSQLSPQASMGLLATRSAGASMTAVGIEANRWIPTLRAVTTATMIGLIPFLVILLVTPFSGAVFKLVTGFFFLTTTWGVVDVVIHNQAISAGLRAMAEITQYKLGWYAMTNYSLEAQKAAGLYGQLRLEGFLFSTFIAGAFGFSSMSAFSHFVMGMQGAVAQGATGAAQTTMTPAGRGQFEKANLEGAASNEALSQAGGAEMFRKAAGVHIKRQMTADPYFDQQAIERAQDNVASGLTAQKSGKALSDADRMQPGSIEGATDRLHALQKAGILGPAAGLEQLAQFEGHSGQGGDEKGQHGYTVDGSGNVVMSTTASGETRKTAGAELTYQNDSDRVVSGNLANFTPSLDNMHKDARRDGFSTRIAANKTFQDMIQHGSSHHQKYGKYGETADMLSNSVNQNMTSTIANDRSLQTRLQSSTDKTSHVEVGIPRVITSVSGSGGGYSVQWKDSSGKDFTSTLRGSDAEAFSTAYNHAISNTFKTASADEKTSQDVHNLMSNNGLSNESAELHSIDSEQALSESQRINLTGAFVEHEAQKPEFAAIANIKDRNQAAADYINYAAVHDPQSINKDFGAFVQKYDTLKPADTAGVQAKAEKDISKVQEQQTAAAPTLDHAEKEADKADLQSHQQAAPATLVKPDAAGHEAKRDSQEAQITAGKDEIVKDGDKVPVISAIGNAWNAKKEALKGEPATQGQAAPKPEPSFRAGMNAGNQNTVKHVETPDIPQQTVAAKPEQHAQTEKRGGAPAKEPVPHGSNDQ